MFRSDYFKELRVVAPPDDEPKLAYARTELEVSWTVFAGGAVKKFSRLAAEILAVHFHRRIKTILDV